MIKYRLGLDVGPFSVGWAIVEYKVVNGEWFFQRIVRCGSRIIPVDTSGMKNFMLGQSVTRTAERTQKRRIRRLYQRSEDRRARLNRVLDVLGFLPEHYKQGINEYGKFTSFP